MADERKKILVVEDEPDQRAYLTTLLKDNGYNVVTASDGRKALETARTEKPDLVILDIMMPDQTGTDFNRKLSRDKNLKDTPIIVVSGLSVRYLAVKKAVAVFDKPIVPEEFLVAALQ